MALTLADAAKLSNDLVLQGVIETVVKDSDVLPQVYHWRGHFTIENGIAGQVMGTTSLDGQSFLPQGLGWQTQGSVYLVMERLRV